MNHTDESVVWFRKNQKLSNNDVKFSKNRLYYKYTLNHFE